MVGGTLVLAGWLLHLPLLKSGLPGLVSMKPNTALAFVLAGAALVLLAPPSPSPRWSRAGRALALAVFLIGGLTLGEFLTGGSWGIDELLFRDDPGAVATSIPGRMAPSTAACFVALGLALAGVGWEPRRGLRPAEPLAALAGAVATLSLVEYAYDREILYGFSQFTRMALHTAALMLVLSAGVLLARPALGLAGVLQRSMAGALERRVRVSLALGLAALLLMGIVSFFNASDSVRHSAEVRQTEARRRELLALLSLLQDMETGHRGYVITGRAEFLEPWDAALRAIERQYSALSSLLRDDPVKSRLLRALEPVMREKIAFSRRVVETHRAGGIGAAALLIQSGEGKRLMDDLRARVAVLDDTEVRQLALLEEHEQEATRRLDLTIVLGTLLALGVVAYAIAILHVELARRRKTEEDLRLLNEGLDQRVRERTAELEQAGAALREGEERFRMMVENVKDYAIIMLDPGGCIVSWNAGASHLKGYLPEEAIGLHFSCFYPEEDAARGKPARELEAAATAGRFEDEGWRVRKDGSRFWANVVITAVRDQTGQLRGFAKITRDITERKQAEEKILALNASLEKRVAQRTAELTEANRELALFNQTMVGREQRIIEMKEEINALCRELGRAPGYPPVWRKET